MKGGTLRRDIVGDRKKIEFAINNNLDLSLAVNEVLEVTMVAPHSSTLS